MIPAQRVLRLATRSLGRRLGSTLSLVAAVSIGAAVCGAFYTSASALRFSQDEVKDHTRLVRLELAPADMANLVEHDRARVAELQAYFESSLAVRDSITFSLEAAFEIGSRAETEWNIRPAFVSPNFHEVLGIETLQGRQLSEAGAVGTTREVVITEDLWISRFGADSGVIDQVVQIPGAIRGLAWRIVGVVPSRVSVPPGVNFWIASTRPGPLGIPSIARLADGVTAAQLRDQVRPVSVVDFEEYVTPGNASFVAFFSMLGFTLMLIACTQAGSLLLARSMGRLDELRIYVALGARPQELAATIAVESGALALAAVLISSATIGPLATAIVGLFPDASSAIPSVRVAWSTIAVTSLLITGVTFLMTAPSLALVRVVDITSLVRTDRGSVAPDTTWSRIFHSLFPLQVAATAGIIYLVVLLGVSYGRVSAVDLGYQLEPILALPVPGVLPDPVTQRATLSMVASHRALTGAALSDLRGLGSVEGAAATGLVPMQPSTCETLVFRAASDGVTSGIAGYSCTVSSGFLRVLGASPIAGREPAPAETVVPNPQGGPVAVNESFARYLAQFGDPIGQTVRLGPNNFFRVDAVVEDLRLHRPDTEPPPTLFFYGSPDGGGAILIRARSQAQLSAVATDALRVAKQIWGVRASDTILRPLDQAIKANADYGGRALIVLLLSLSAVPVALMGVTSAAVHTVSRRRRELAIRQALGLSGGAASWLVVKRFGLLSVLSAGIGVAVAALATSQSDVILFGVRPLEVWLCCAVVAGMTGACALAAYVPTHSIGRLDLSDSLRGN